MSDIKVRVSVCMATYNGAAFIRDQIDSILPQLGLQDELIISDDRSVDQTCTIVREYTDPRIRLVINEGGHGCVPNFSNAIAQARGEYIALSDQDDIWTENRLEHQLALLRPLPPCSLVVGDFEQFGNKVGRVTLPALGPSPRSMARQFIWLFLGKLRYFGCTFLFQRDLLRHAHPIPNWLESPDWWFAMNACVHGRIFHLQESTLLHRIHDNNVTAVKRRPIKEVLRSRLGYLIALLGTGLREKR